MTRRVSHRALLTALIAASGCAIVGDDYAPPEVLVQDAFAAASESGYVDELPQDLGRWWQQLNDPVLDELVERALQGSFDLESAVANVRRVAAIRGQAIGNRFPDLDGFGSYNRTRIGSNTVPANPDPTTFDLYSLGLELSWEVDLWGRVTRVIEAAQADVEASVEDLRNVRAVLVAEVVSTYIDLREGQARLEVAARNIETQRRSLGLTQTRFEAGAAPRLDVAQARTNVANTQATLPLFQQAVRTAQLRLAALLGEDPSVLPVPADGSAELPAPPDAIAVGMPAELLRQRPDVRAAERRLAGEVARVGVELADLLPRFTLGGSIGYEATGSGSLLDQNSGFLGLGPAFRWNLFDGGRERGEVRAQREAAKIALLDYRQTVLLAFEEVEGAMFGLARDRERTALLAEAVAAAQDSAELARVLYLEGKSDFQNVLDSERSLFDAQDTLISNRADVAQRFVLLLRSLGGGWQQPEVLGVDP